MSIGKKLAAFASALAVTVTAFASTASADSYKVKAVSTPFEKVIGSGKEFEPFGKMDSNIVPYFLSEIYCASDKNKSSNTFGSVDFYTLSAETVENFRDSGKLSLTKLSCDSALNNISTEPIGYGLYGDAATYKYYGVEFDKKNKKLSIKDDSATEVYTLFKDTLDDGYTYEEIVKNDGSSNDSIRMTSPDGTVKTKKFNDGLYFADTCLYKDAIYTSRTDCETSAVLYKITGDLTTTKLWESKASNGGLFAAAYAGEYGGKLLLMKYYYKNGQQSGYEIVKYDTKTKKETSILKHIDGKDNYAFRELYDDCLFFSGIVTGEYGSYADSDGTYMYDLKKSKLTKLKVSYPIAYFHKVGDLCVLEYPNGDNTNKFSLYDLKNNKLVKSGYDSMLGIAGKYIAAYKFNGKTEKIKSAEYYTTSLKKLSYDRLLSFDCVIEEFGAIGNYGYYNGDYSLVLKGGKAWFVDENLKQVSAAFKADDIREIGYGLYAYSSGGKNYFVTYNDTSVVKPAKVSGLKVSAKTKKTMTLGWTAVKGAAGYSVDVYKNGEWVNAGTTKKTSLKVSGLTKGTQYKVRVRAYTTTKAGNKVYGSAATVTAKTNK